MMEYEHLVASQRQHILRGGTLDVQTRKEILTRLGNTIRAYEPAILAALEADLNKSAFEGYMSEVGMVLDELKFQIRHVERWAKPKRVRTPLTQFPAKSLRVPEPYGVVLIMAPWNYPFQLCMTPLIGAISAGNTVILKPSAYARHTSEVIAAIVSEVFDPSYVAVVQGGRKENELLLEQRFDHIFFTGSVAVGKLVMEKAAKSLTPVTLELGGKSPVLVDGSADVELAAKRIAFGKMLNAGQTCIAPDYVLVDAKIKDKLLYHLKRSIEEFFPLHDLQNFPTIINEKHFDRLMGLLENQSVAYGGTGDRNAKRIVPTILDKVEFDSPVMQEEIFGPILPIIAYGEIQEAIDHIISRPKPLALYLFSEDRHIQWYVTERVSFGGGCINDTVVHIATSYLGFGGVGESGMGSYHGKASFDTFTHYKGIVKRYRYLDFPFRYHPYSSDKLWWVRKLLK